MVSDPDLHRAQVLISRLMRPTFSANMARGMLSVGGEELQPGASKRYTNALTEIDNIAKELYGSKG